MKKAVQKMCAAFIAAFVFALCLFAKPNTAQAAGGGWLYLNPEDNTWYYYVDGMVDTSYTGLAQNDFGWWYVSNGTIDWNYTGMAANELDGGMFPVVQLTGIILAWLPTILDGGISPTVY